MKKAVVISGFPGIGKSYYFQEMSSREDFVVLDSDSSKFDKSKFPWNYIDHIESNLNNADVILVSSHEEVRKALKEAGIYFYTVCPQVGLMEEYRQRYIDRGSPDGFIRLITDNWIQWIEGFDYANQSNAFTLTSGKFLSDIMPMIFAYHNQTKPIHPKDFYNSRRGLMFSEWSELLALEYVLTWNYSDDPEKDAARHKELQEKKYS